MTATPPPRPNGRTQAGCGHSTISRGARALAGSLESSARALSLRHGDSRGVLRRLSRRSGAACVLARGAPARRARWSIAGSRRRSAGSRSTPTTAICTSFATTRRAGIGSLPPIGPWRAEAACGQVPRSTGRSCHAGRCSLPARPGAVVGGCGLWEWRSDRIWAAAAHSEAHLAGFPDQIGSASIEGIGGLRLRGGAARLCRGLTVLRGAMRRRLPAIERAHGGRRWIE